MLHRIFVAQYGVLEKVWLKEQGTDPRLDRWHGTHIEEQMLNSLYGQFKTVVGQQARLYRE